MANSADPDQLLLQKPTGLDLRCLQTQGISGFCKTRVKYMPLKRPVEIHVDIDILLPFV